MTRIAVLDYGIGNLRSAQKALEHVGADARLTDDVKFIRGADAVVLPGVGAFGPCIEALRARGLDEALVDVALDLSGRPYLHYEVDFPGEKILGDPPFDPQLVEEFWRALVVAAGITLHVTLVRGKNTHHIVEATFKAVARSLRDAVVVEGGGVPSTKGTL